MRDRRVCRDRAPKTPRGPRIPMADGHGHPLRANLILSIGTWRAVTRDHFCMPTEQRKRGLLAVLIGWGNVVMGPDSQGYDRHLFFALVMEYT